MVLLDTSAWIRYFKKGGLSFDQLKSVVVCPPVVQEVLQGIKHPTYWRIVHDGLTSLPCISNPVGLEIFVQASDIYRRGRAKGLTIRSASDCLIAAMAIEADVPIHHFDRDFEAISTFTSLRTAPSLRI